jgi:hypothetical protein
MGDVRVSRDSSAADIGELSPTALPAVTIARKCLLVIISILFLPSVRAEGRGWQAFVIVQIAVIAGHGIRISDGDRLGHCGVGDDHGLAIDDGIGPSPLLVFPGDGEAF